MAEIKALILILCSGYFWVTVALHFEIVIPYRPSFTDLLTSIFVLGSGIAFNIKH